MEETRVTMRHKYYYDPKKIDLSVLRKEAVQQSKDRRFTPNPAPVVIHWHGHGEACTGKFHESYVNGEMES